MCRFFTRRLAVIIVAFSFGGIFGQAFAATNTYSNRSLFEATLGTIVRDDYENPAYQPFQTDAQMNAVLGETKYTTTFFSNSNRVVSFSGTNVYCAGCNGSFIMDFTSTTVSDPSGVFGVGFDYFNDPYHAEVTFGDLSKGYYQLPGGGGVLGGSGSGFFGLSSTLGIRSINITGDFFGGPSGSCCYLQDNLTIGNGVSVAPVPEPETYAMMLAGLGLLGAMARRRKQKLNA